MLLGYYMPSLPTYITPSYLHSRLASRYLYLQVSSYLLNMLTSAQAATYTNWKARPLSLGICLLTSYPPKRNNTSEITYVFVSSNLLCPRRPFNKRFQLIDSKPTSTITIKVGLCDLIG